MELFPPWFLNSRVRHAGLPRKAAVPPLGPVWPLPPIAGSEFSPSSGSTHFNKTTHNKSSAFGASDLRINAHWDLLVKTLLLEAFPLLQTVSCQRLLQDYPP